jgi:transcriptional regulator with XRE-family HTH domain
MEANQQMQELGRVLRRARQTKGLSTRGVAEPAGVTHSFIAKLEAGKFRTVSSVHLGALARVLDLPAEDLFALAGYKVPESLPTFGPYLRARYGEELPAHAMDSLSELFEALREKYAGPDQVNDEEDDATVGGGVR